jgi:predicted metalloprotease
LGTFDPPRNIVSTTGARTCAGNAVRATQTSRTAAERAAAIGDDRIQKMAGRGVHPEKFTHGSSAQRVQWFRRGLETGLLAACDAFSER